MTPIIPPAIRLRARLLPFLLLCGLSLPVHATTLYLRTTQSSSGSWDSANWATTPTGTGTVSALASGNTYDTNTRILRTPNTSTPTTFAGDALVINGGGLTLKANSISIDNLSVTATGGSISHAGTNTGTTADVAVNQFAVDGSLELTGGFNNRTIALNITTLSGSGNIQIGTGTLAGVTFAATTATAYTGTISLSSFNLNFNNDLTTHGGLNLSGTGVLTLDQNLTFASVSIGGTALAAGSYSFSDLNSSFDAFFTNGGSGSITVASLPEPSAFVLIVSSGIFLCVVHRRRPR